MKYSEIVDKVSLELNISRDIVDRTYKLYWRFIKNSIQSLPLKLNLSEEEFNKLSTSFNIPSLGKLAITWTRYIGVKKRFNHISHLKSKGNEYKEDLTTI